MRGLGSLSGYLAALLLVALSSLVCELLRPHLIPVNMVMIYLLAVVLAASRLGLRPAILTALLAVLAFDFLFVPPRFSFRVTDAEYLVTFFGLFVVGVVISSLVAQIKEKADLIRKQEAKTSSLYHLTRELAAAIDIPAVERALQRAVQRNLGGRMALLFELKGALETATEERIALDSTGMEIARWVLRSGRSAGTGTASFAENPFLFLPLKASGSVLGIMVLEGQGIDLNENQQLVEAFAGLAAMALERVELALKTENARIMHEKELLERALLNSISHDLRTPLVTISGVLGSMLDEKLSFSQEKGRQLLATAFDEAGRLNRFVGSLLDMTRLEAGALRPNFAPCDLEDIIGCAVGAVEQRLGSHQLTTDIEAELPPVPADIVLLTQALVNLLDNAVKYSPDGTEINIAARKETDGIIIAISDQGPGVPAGEEERIFDKFHRLQVPERRGGAGLGLSIVKGIVEAHGGRVRATNLHGRGLLVEVLLPLQEADISREESHE
jgi:two-component system sensor histidine kinase KdpD